MSDEDAIAAAIAASLADQNGTEEVKKDDGEFKLQIDSNKEEKKDEVDLF